MLTDLLEKMGFDLPQQEWEKPIIGVSACLTGQKVRYDGDHKHNAILVHRWGPCCAFAKPARKWPLACPCRARPSRWCLSLIHI